MARKRSTFHPDAAREAKLERDYYEQAAALGAEFAEALEAALARACRAPRRARVIGILRGEAVRGVRLERFPFRLLYVDRPSGVRVVALVHDRREPDYWRGRHP